MFCKCVFFHLRAAVRANDNFPVLLSVFETHLFIIYTTAQKGRPKGKVNVDLYSALSWTHL